MDTRQLILDTANKIFTDHCDKKLLDAAETGEFASELWGQVTENGFDQLGSAGSGTELADMFAFVQQCGHHAVPLPLAETLLVNFWCGPQEGLSSFGELSGDRIDDVAWGRQAQRVVGIGVEGSTLTVVETPEVIGRGTNMAGEARDQVSVGSDATTVEATEDPYAMAALTRVNLLAGGLHRVLDLGLLFATERVQFGRTISKFQAIQHSLAIVAAEVAAAQRAADAAVDAIGTDRFVYEVAAGKARVGEAVGVVAEQVHQIHGAMGFTHEHSLHHYTRRVWAWRDEWGNEFYWQALLGNHLASLGADNSWDFIATRG